MRLIHQPHNHTPVILISLRQLPPQSREITPLRAPRRPNRLPVPPRVIMNINNTMRTRSQARLHQCIVLCKIGLVESTAEDIIDEILPGDGEAKDVESIGFCKMCHLAGTIAAAVLGEGWIDGGEGAGALWGKRLVLQKLACRDNGDDDEKGEYTYIGSTAKIETSDIDACKLDTTASSSEDRPNSGKSYNRASEKLRDGMHRRQRAM